MFKLALYLPGAQGRSKFWLIETADNNNNSKGGSDFSDPFEDFCTCRCDNAGNGGSSCTNYATCCGG